MSQRFGFGTARYRYWPLSLAVAILVVIRSTASEDDTRPRDVTVKQIVQDLLDSVDANKPPELGSLADCGPGAIPDIVTALAKLPDSSCKYLLVVLRGIGGKPARLALVELTRSSSSAVVRGHAFTMLRSIPYGADTTPDQERAAVMASALEKLTANETKSASYLVREFLEAAEGSGVPDSGAFILRGEEMIPATLDALPGANERGQGLLLAALAVIGGENVTAAILELGLHHPSDRLRRKARGELAAGLLVGPFRVSEEDAVAIVAHVLEEPIIHVDTWAVILSKCDDLDPLVRAKPIVQRFLAQLKNPEPVPLSSASFPTETYVLAVLLKALERIGAGCLPLLCEAQAENQDETSLDWFLVARGFAGDGTITSDLRGVIENEANEYLRVVALDAYVRVAGEDAVPLLHDYAAKLPPQTYSYQCRPSVDAQLGLTARGALLKMGQEVP